jgi:hypothetical protein
MDDISPEPDHAVLAADQPGTIGCVTVYGLMALIGILPIVPSPYGLVLACALTGIYVGLILVFGQGSIIEMGLLACVLLVLSCLIAVAIRGPRNAGDPAQPAENHSMQRSGEVGRRDANNQTLPPVDR